MAERVFGCISLLCEEHARGVFWVGERVCLRARRVRLALDTNIYRTSDTTRRVLVVLWCLVRDASTYQLPASSLLLLAQGYVPK